jgi:hypothetical protein
MLFLRPGEACHYKIGTTLHVVYIEQDGRSHVKSITPLPAARKMSAGDDLAVLGSGVRAPSAPPKLRRFTDTGQAVLAQDRSPRRLFDPDFLKEGER